MEQEYLHDVGVAHGGGQEKWRVGPGVGAPHVGVGVPLKQQPHDVNIACTPNHRRTYISSRTMPT